jgi:HAD superfamily hydrolase (TIGR01490 family)
MPGRQHRHSPGPRPVELLPEQVTTAGAPTRPGALAVFDLDRTLLPGSSVSAMARAMADAGWVPRWRLAGAAIDEARFRRRGATDGAAAALREEALQHVAGLDRAPLVALAQDVADRLVATVTPAAWFLLERHLDAGDFVVILSASPQELVEAVARRMGAHRAVGTRAEVSGGTYTGRLDGPFCYGAAKIERLVQDVGRVDFASTWGYADSGSDLPLLFACGNPVAVNPDRRLREVATRRRWPILGLR